VGNLRAAVVVPRRRVRRGGTVIRKPQPVLAESDWADARRNPVT
jgi:hypothetical protein